MIARLLRLLWCAAIVTAAGAAWFSIHRFGPIVGPWVAGLAAVMAVAAIHPLAIACNFVFSRIAGDPVPPASRLSLWRAIATLDAEIDASMRGVWFATPFLDGRPTPQARGTARPLSLLFVHGYFCNRAVWHSFMREGAARGYRCEAITLADPMVSIDSHDDAIAAAIRSLCSFDDDRVVIIGHSMGGLVARSALQRMVASRVAHVFTLGTPHHGTLTARFGLATSLAEMRLGSRWLTELAAREMAGAGLPRSRYTTIFSHHDDIVYPQTTACLDGAECIAIGGCGHVALLYDARVRTLVFERLAALDVQPPAGAAS
jgi:pimeloyl-ACP methyl ester carboxylesterase